VLKFLPVCYKKSCLPGARQSSFPSLFLWQTTKSAEMTAISLIRSEMDFAPITTIDSTISLHKSYAIHIEVSIALKALPKGAVDNAFLVM